MSDVRATIVVRYGDGVDKGAFSLALLDEKMNIDAAGNVKTSFLPGDLVYFLVQLDPSLRIDKVLATDGQVVYEGECLRDRVDRTLFDGVSGARETSAIPAGPVTPKWYGRVGRNLKVEGRQMSVLTITGCYPALADMSYQARFKGYRLEPPAISLAEGETYPVTIVIYIEAAA